MLELSVDFAFAFDDSEVDSKADDFKRFSANVSGQITLSWINRVRL
jgi:hypothetical protein